MKVKNTKILIYLILSALKTFDNVEEVSEVNPLFNSSPWAPGELELIEEGDD